MKNKLDDSSFKRADEAAVAIEANFASNKSLRKQLGKNDQVVI
jgi:hypothetical protein